VISSTTYGYVVTCPKCKATKEAENADGTISLNDAILYVRRAGWLTTFDGKNWTWTCTCPKCKDST